MYSYYDRDSDGLISVDELSYSQAADHLEKLAHVCSLLDILVYSPVSQNVAADSVDLNTFYREFGGFPFFALLSSAITDTDDYRFQILAINSLNFE